MDDDALDDIAEELYGVPPEEFVAARTAARDRVRGEDKELAQAVAALPKPTTAAWVCNLLVRRRPEEVSQLRERQKRNIFATLMFSEGVPMIYGGDELSRDYCRRVNRWIPGLL